MTGRIVLEVTAMPGAEGGVNFYDSLGDWMLMLYFESTTFPGSYSVDIFSTCAYSLALHPPTHMINLDDL